MLIYGVAEASTAYLITKITDPPPPPAYAHDYAEAQTRWKNKVEFLKLPLENLDAHNVSLLKMTGGGGNNNNSSGGGASTRDEGAERR